MVVHTVPVLSNDGWGGWGVGLTVFNSTKFERNIALIQTVLGPDYMSRPGLVSKMGH